MRQRFIDKTIQQAELIGLTVPDPDLKWNEERQSYDWGEINWDEFYAVINGNGLANRQRVAQHMTKVNGYEKPQKRMRKNKKKY